MASIYQRGRIWYLKGKLKYPNGEIVNVRHSLGKDFTKDQALAARDDLTQREHNARQGIGEDLIRPGDLTVAEVVRQYKEHAGRYYVKNDKPTSEVSCIKSALTPLLTHYGPSLARNFTPKKLKHLREVMIEEMGWARKNTNKNVHRVRRCFRWATEEGLVEGNIYGALMAVSALRAGRTKARETEKIAPVNMAHVEAIKPHVSRQVWAMIQLQLFTGARSGEVIGLKPEQVDTSGDVWVARPADHKGQHHEKDRALFLGPKAKKVLRPFMPRPAGAHCFSPREAEQERHSRAKSHRRANQKPNATKTKRVIKDHYDAGSYRKAIVRACEVAGVEHHWHPHQLRHTFATNVRKAMGLESSATALGHAHMNTAEIYAETNLELAREVALRLG